MNLVLNKPLFITDTDMRIFVNLNAITKDTTLTIQYKEKDDTAYSTFAVVSQIFKNELHKTHEFKLAGLEENKTYDIQVIATNGTETLEKKLEVKTKEGYLERYRQNLKSIFKELTGDDTVYNKMMNDMQDEVDKFSFDEFQQAQVMAQYMATITSSMTTEASRTAIAIADKQKTNAKNGDLLNKQIKNVELETELKETQISTTKDSVKHNLLIKMLQEQRGYGLNMASNSIIPQAAAHTNFYMGVKEGYRWAGFTYTSKGKLLGTDGVELGSFETKNIAG